MNRRGPLIAGGVSGVVALVAVVLLVLPKMNQVGEARDELQKAEDQEVTLEVQLRALEDAQAAAPKTKKQLQKIANQIPGAADLPALFRLLQSAADRAAVDFFTFSPGTPTADASGGFSVILSQITVTGGYFALDEFLYKLENLPRAAKVTSIAITPTTTETGGEEQEAAPITASNLQMQLSVEFYTTDASAGPGSEPGPTGGLTSIPSALAPSEGA